MHPPLRGEAETLAKISLAQFGRKLSAETKTAISISLGTIIFTVY